MRIGIGLMRLLVGAGTIMCGSVLADAVLAKTAADHVNSSISTVSSSAKKSDGSSHRGRRGKLAKSANRVVAEVNDELITRREVELYRTGKLYSGLNPGLVLNQGIDYRQALEELIDIKLELQVLRSNMGDSHWKEMTAQVLADYARSVHTTVKEFVDSASKQLGLDREEANKNIAETMILQRYRQETFGSIVSGTKFSGNQIVDARKKMRRLMVPTVPFLTVKDKHYSVIPSSSAKTGGEKGGVGDAQPSTVESTQEQQVLLEQLSKVYLKPALLEQYLKQHPEVAVQEHEWHDAMLTELPDLFVEVVKKLKSGETAPLVLAPNGVHAVTLVSAVSREIPAEMLQERVSDIPEDSVVLLLQRCRMHELARDKIQKEVRPYSYVQLFD